MTAEPDALPGPDEPARPAVPGHRSFRSVAGPLTLLRVSGQGLEFVAFVILARRLGADTFGLLAVPLLIARYAGIVADWGASVRGPRDVAAASSPASMQALIRRRTQVSTALLVLFVATAVALGHTEIAPLGVTIMARGLQRDWMALGQERGARAGLPSVLQGVVVVGGSLAVTTLTGASLVFAAGYALAAIASVRLNPRPAAGDTTDHHAPVDGWLLSATLADQVYLTSDTILLGWLVSDRAAGIYAAIYRLPNAWMTVIGLVAVGILPGLTRRVRDDPTLVRYLRRRALRFGALASAVVLATVPVAYFLVPVVFGREYEAGQWPLVILMLTVALVTFTVALDPLYLAIGSDRVYATRLIVVAVLNIATNVIVLPRWELTGAATVTFGSQVLLSAFLLVATRRRTHLLERTHAAATAPPRPDATPR